jgi:predicted nuclease with RNAse H fold
MRTVGIDLSADPRRTAICTIDWQTASVMFDKRGATDQQLVEVALTADRVGIDAPFGWPDAFIDAVVAHQTGQPWPGRQSDPVANRRTLRYRATDLRIAESGRIPLSPSSDLIAVTTMRCAALQDLISQQEPVDRAGIDGKLVEVYPAAALRAWDFTDVGYKGSEGRAMLGELAANLVEHCKSLEISNADLERCSRDDDEFDAFVCALVARAASLGLTELPQPALLGQARLEGWIHVPTVGLAELVQSGCATEIS